MMTKTALMLIAVALVLSGSASAAGDVVPPVVEQAVREARASCNPGRSTIKAGLISCRDVNGDQVSDFILDYGKVECDGSRYSCGSGGCTMQVFASLPDGSYRKVLDDTVRGLKFVKLKGRSAVIVDQHGSACGRVGSAPCSATLYWNGSTFSPSH